MIEMRTLPLITHAGNLTGAHPAGQLFRCERDGLKRIDVRFVGAQDTLVTMRLRAGSPADEVIREVTITPEPDPSGLAWASFEFEAVQDSAGEVFHFSLAPAERREASLSPWVRFHGQTGLNDPWGDRFLAAGALHRGDLLSPHQDLRAIAFPVEVLAPSQGEARLSVFDGPDAEEPIRVVSLSPSDEVRAGWAFFSFEPVPESRWKRYHYELQTPEGCRLIGTEGEGGAPTPVKKTFHGLDDPSSPLLGMTRGALEHSDRDLIFRAWCDDPPEAVFARLVERTGDTLWLACLLWIAATTICLRLFLFSDHAVTTEVEEERDEAESAPCPPAAAVAKSEGS